MTTELDAILRRLHMPTGHRLKGDLQVKAEQEGMGFSDYPSTPMSEEIANRGQIRLQRTTRRGKFPILRTTEEFDFAWQIRLRKDLLGSYFGFEFAGEGRNLFAYGPSGTGKSQVAVTITYRAIQNGSDDRFEGAAHRPEGLSSASRDRRLRDALTELTHTGALVFEKIGFLSLGADAANVLSQVVDYRHLHRRPMVFPTNEPIEEWGGVLHDPDLAEAIFDRGLEQERVLHFRGTSYPNRHLQGSAVPIVSRTSGHSYATSQPHG